MFAGDHGVHAQGVTPWPQEVTAAMIANFRAGGAAVNVLARQAGADVLVVDMGVAADLEPGDRPARPQGPARYVGPGDRAGDEPRRGRAGRCSPASRWPTRLVDAGHDCLLTGDMGIANTTAVGGADRGAHRRSAGDGDRPRHRRRRRDPGPQGRGGAGGARRGRATATTRWRCWPRWAASSTPGSPASCSARGRAPACRSILDGVIAGAAALVAQALAPDAIDYCFAGHRSAEPGHVVALEQLGLRPLVDLDLRLGEGTGAVLAFPLVEAAGALLREMATFDSAGVARKEPA